MANPTKATMNIRINAVASMILQGVSREKILKYANDEGWGVSNRTIDRYVAVARDGFEEVAKVNLKFELGRALSRLDDLYARSVATQDYKNALNIIKERAALVGLYLVNVNAASDDNSKQRHDEFMDALKEWKNAHPEV